MGHVSFSPMFSKWIACAISVCLALMSRAILAAEPPQRYALLIAVNEYEAEELDESKRQFSIADATALGELLSWAGYKVDSLLGEQATQAAIRSKLNDLRDQANPQGIALIALFGHGVDLVLEGRQGPSSEACFCPFDLRVHQVDQTTENSIPLEKGNGSIEIEPDSVVRLSEVIEAVRAAKAMKRVLLTDCSPRLTAESRNHTFGSDFQFADVPSTTVVMFSGLPNDQLFDHPDWRHSAFTRRLLSDMEDLYATGHLSTGALADRMKKSVPQLVAKVSTNHHQTPRVFATGHFDLQFARQIGQYHFAGKQAGEGRELAPGIVFHWCPSGDFTMGSPRDEADRHANEHAVDVSLTGFWLGETEITQGQWNALMNSHPWRGKSNVVVGRLHLRLEVKERADHAASYISHGGNLDGTIEPDSAMEFCRLLTLRERKAGRLPNGWKYALPTEAQWEYACRAGSTTRFCFGDDDKKLSQYGWWGAQYNTGNARPEPYPNQVAAKHANAWGLHDMHGNVWEWCSDWFIDSLPGGRNPQVQSAGSLRVCRGGCWLLNSAACRSAIRSGGSPDNRNSVTGFRVAAVPTTE